MKNEKSEFSSKRISITFYKNSDILQRDIRVKSNWYLKRGFSKKNSFARASAEVTNVQNTQVLVVQNSIDLEPIADLVADIAGKRSYKFTSELIK